MHRPVVRPNFQVEQSKLLGSNKNNVFLTILGGQRLGLGGRARPPWLQACLCNNYFNISIINLKLKKKKKCEI